MATFIESTSQGNPSNGNPSLFPSFGNTRAPYMEMLSLPGFTIGLPVWLFLTSVISSVQTIFQPSYPPLNNINLMLILKLTPHLLPLFLDPILPLHLVKF